jgi:glutathione peroxidase
MQILDSPIMRLDGTPTTLGEILDGRLALLVNVASRCGSTPQYTGLEKLQEMYGDDGFTVVGLPCNQFGGQEPGSAEEIAQFCSATYGVSFPMTEKIDVNGEGRHPIYTVLTQAPDEQLHTGDVQWNFEKFLVTPSGEVVARFSTDVEPLDPMITDAVQSRLGRMTTHD